MPNHKLLASLRRSFSLHGKPTHSEDPEWAIVLLTQVLLIEAMEKLMSTIQDLADRAKEEAAALVDLNNTVVTMSPPKADNSGGTGGTSLTAQDQTLLDTAHDTIKSNIAKIAEIKTALGMPAQPAPSADGGSAPAPSLPSDTGTASAPAVIPPNSDIGGAPASPPNPAPDTTSGANPAPAPDTAKL